MQINKIEFQNPKDLAEYYLMDELLKIHETHCTAHYNVVAKVGNNSSHLMRMFVAKRIFEQADYYPAVTDNNQLKTIIVNTDGDAIYPFIHCDHPAIICECPECRENGITKLKRSQETCN